jgi:hypothetical protein
MNIIKVSVREKDINDSQKVKDLCKLLKSFRQIRIDQENEAAAVIEQTVR